MKLAPVKSSNVEAVGYDEDSRVLRVKFKGGREYDYENIPPKMFETLMESHSIGSYLATVIKPVRPGRPVLPSSPEQA